MTPPSLRQQVARIRNRDLTSVELIDSALAKIEVWNPSINALRFVNTDAARLAAVQKDELVRAGASLGRLHGVPYCVKDHINVAGLPRSEGTRLYEIEAAKSSAAMIELLEAEGAICIGKSNMAEYGKSYYTDNLAFGRSSNPFDLTRTCGGSGGADAAAIACGMASFGLGADSGGSLRVPANFCGQFGIHPTHGTITSAGLINQTSTISALTRAFGPLATCLDDLELLWRILVGYDWRDPYSVAHPNAAAVTKRRFLYFDTLNGVRCDPEIQTSLVKCAQRFESCGYRADQGAPVPFAAAIEIFILIAGQAALISEDLAAATRRQPRDPQAEGPLMLDLRARLAARLEPLVLERFFAASQRCDELRREASKIFEQYDFVLAPVAATLAMPHGTTSFELAGQTLESHQVFQFSSCINLLDLPAIAFPTGISSSAIPLGLQIIGPRFGELELFKILRMAGFQTGLEPKG